MTFDSMMVDLETNGTDPEHNAIIQIAAVKFNYATGEIGPAFDRCLAMAPSRYQDQGTMEWWRSHQHVYDSIIARAEAPTQVMGDFFAFASHDAPSGGYALWAKPTSFEFPFLSSYFRQFGLPNPFHYRKARDMNSFIAGLRGAPSHVDMQHVPSVGNEHNALDDVYYQLSVLFHAREGKWG